MARMIPRSISASTPSDGEVSIFNEFQSSNDTPGWVVLHSLDIAKHISQVSGEADFIILVPKLGVLCLEVKACRSLRREQGGWLYGRSNVPDFRGPFKQSEGVKHSVIEFIKKKFNGQLKAPFFSAVAFTHLDFNEQSPEWHSWQIIDKRRIDQFGIVQCIVNSLKGGLKHLQQSLTLPLKEGPSQEVIEELVGVLRSEFEYFESPASRKKRTFAEVKKYTEEQFQALDSAEFNDRMAYIGPAGTGKTFLAIETARREVENGKRVLLLCYNEMLGERLKEEVRPLGNKITCGTISSFMLKVSGLRPESYRAFWEYDLPQAAKVAFKATQEPFDVLVVDEAQDFMSLEFIDFLDSAVRGGLSEGHIRFFGDFSGQAVQKSEVSLKELKDGWVKDLAIFNLGKNCRNTPRVGHLAGGFMSGAVKYAGFLREDDGVKPNIHRYGSAEEQSDLLIKTLTEYKSAGVAWDEIAILSFNVKDGVLSTTMDMFSSTPHAEMKEVLDNGLICTTVRRFKGMERYGVIVTDIDDISQKNLTELLYIASSRTVGRLTLLMHRHVATNLKVESLQYAA